MITTNFYAQDAQGNILPGADVFVYLTGTTTLATGLTTALGAALANPFKASATAQIQFKAPDGNYDVRVKSGARESTLRGVQIVDAIAGFSYINNYLADADQLGLTTLNQIIKYAADHGVPVQGRGAYTITTETISLTGKRVVLNLSESTIQRTANSTLTLSNPDSLLCNFGIMKDTIALSTRMIEVFNGTEVEFGYRLGITDGTPFYLSGVKGARAIGIKGFRAFTQPVVSADQGRPYEMKSCADVVTFDVDYGKCGTGFKIEAVSTGTSDNIIIGNINGSDTYDTSLFLRLVATAGTFKRLVLSQVTIDKAGKAGVKFSADSATGLVLRQAILSDVIVTGYARNVSSPGISSFKDATGSPDVLVGEVVFNGCIVDGYAADGSIGATTGDCSGVSLRYLDHAVLNGLITRNTLNQGILIQGVNKVTGAGNIVTGAGITAGASALLSAGVALVSVQFGTLQVDSHENLGSGFYLDKAKWMKLSGVLKGNARYGIETLAAGLAAAQTTGNTYQFTGSGNTLGFASYVERVNEGLHSEEIGCIDDSGPRSKGTTVRRDAMTLQWSSGMFPGKLFFNTTTQTLQIWTGTAWKEA